MCFFFCFAQEINCQVICLEHFVLRFLEINKTDTNHCNSLLVLFLIKCVFGGQHSAHINYF